LGSKAFLGQASLPKTLANHSAPTHLSIRSREPCSVPPLSPTVTAGPCLPVCDAQLSLARGSSTVQMPRWSSVGLVNVDSDKSRQSQTRAADITPVVIPNIGAGAATQEVPLCKQVVAPQPWVSGHGFAGHDADAGIDPEVIDPEVIDPEVVDLEVLDVDESGEDEEEEEWSAGQDAYYGHNDLSSSSPQRLAVPKGEEAYWHSRWAMLKGEDCRPALPKREANPNGSGFGCAGVRTEDASSSLPMEEEEGEVFDLEEEAEDHLDSRETSAAPGEKVTAQALPEKVVDVVEVADDVAWSVGSHEHEEPVLGESIGLWLDESDFVICHEGGHQVGVGSAVDVGAHGCLRNWPRVYSSSKQGSKVLRNMLSQTSGPCPAKRVQMIGRPDRASQKLILQNTKLQPMQSFENACVVRKFAGYHVVRGWVVYDLMNSNPGEGYIAQRYWWNMTADGRWVDFTPRPEGMASLLLVEALEVSPRKARILTDDQLALADGLYCLRFKGASATVRTESGKPESIRLTNTDIKGGCELRSAMMAAALGGALTGQLSNDSNLFPIVLLQSILMRCLRADTGQGDTLGLFIAADGIEALARLLESKTAEVAALAAANLAILCRRSCTAKKQLTKQLDGARLLAGVFARAEVKNAKCPIADVAHHLWRMQSVAVDSPLARSQHVGVPDDGSQEYWESLRDHACCASLQTMHAESSPFERRAWSWSRTLAFSRMCLGSRGVAVRRGSFERPFVIWVLGAEEAVEAQLARDGFFDDANLMDRAPTEIVIIGKELQEYHSGDVPQEGRPPSIRITSDDLLVWKMQLSDESPDLAVVFMPEAPEPQMDGSQLSQGVSPLPDSVLTAVAHVPVIITTRYGLGESGAMALRCKLRGQIIMQQVRSPFSSSAARPQSMLDDNGWIFAVCGPGAVAKALQMEAPPLQAASSTPQGPSRTPALFWGILDIKYDTSRPVLERVKVLETGDGRTSKFSGDGAGILRRYKERYQLELDPDMQMYQVISADKKLTHDLFEQTGYSHLVPKQVCFPRVYHKRLAADIIEGLGLRGRDNVILKLCNRSRAAGVVVTPASELDNLLTKLLHPPDELDDWFSQRVGRMMEGSPVDFGFKPGDLEEQLRHWWSNESPVFVAETCCRSVPTVLNSRSFDGTLRVGFALRRKHSGKKPWEQHGATTGPEDLDIDWLGGYWKLPKADAGSGSLRDAVVSAARISGTAPVKLAHLFEIYAALGDSVQQLFGSAEPSSEEIRKMYQGQCGLGSYLTARIGTAAMNRHPARTREMLADADQMASTLPECKEKAIVQSFIYRAYGVFEAKTKSDGQDPECWFRDSLVCHPTNSLTLHLQGVAAIQGQRLHAGVELLSKALLLDPDFKASYVNIGIAYLRLGEFERAVQVSEAGLARHPDAPQPQYHIGVACCQLALNMVLTGDPETEFDRLQYEELRQKSLAGFAKARSSDEGRKRNRPNKDASDPPWLEIDEKMIVAMEKDMGDMPLPLPPNIGWFWHSYRL